MKSDLVVTDGNGNIMPNQQEALTEFKRRAMRQSDKADLWADSAEKIKRQAAEIVILEDQLAAAEQDAGRWREAALLHHDAAVGKDTAGIYNTQLAERAGDLVSELLANEGTAINGPRDSTEGVDRA